MNSIIQEEIYGYGIAACVALVGITYAQAKRQQTPWVSIPKTQRFGQTPSTSVNS